MRALVIYDSVNQTILHVKDVPGGIQVVSDKAIVIEDTEVLKELFTLKGYDIQPIIDYENQQG